MNNNDSLNSFVSKKVPFKHFLRAIKKTPFYLFVLLFCGHAVALKAQNVQVSLHHTDVELEAVLNEIEKQTSYLFVSDSCIYLYQKVSINASETALQDVLWLVFNLKNIAYNTEGSNIILRLETKEPATPDSRKT